MEGNYTRQTACCMRFQQLLCSTGHAGMVTAIIKLLESYDKDAGDNDNCAQFMEIHIYNNHYFNDALVLFSLFDGYKLPYLQ